MTSCLQACSSEGVNTNTMTRLRPVKLALAALLVAVLILGLSACTTGGNKGKNGNNRTAVTEKPLPTKLPLPTEQPGPAGVAEADMAAAAEAQPDTVPTDAPEESGIKLFINEILPTDTDSFDAVELFNASGEAVVLSDYYLSDSKKHLNEYRLPEYELGPGEFLVVYCTGEYHKRDEYDMAFKLSYFGEKLYLADAEGNIIDKVAYPRLPAGVSFGRADSGGYRVYDEPSLGEPNMGGCDGLSAIPQVDVAPGFYEDSIAVSFTSGGTIRYTLDGSAPGPYSKLWNGEPIVIDKTCTIRAYSGSEGMLDSFTGTYCYFIGAPGYELDVAVLSIDENDLAEMNENYTSNRRRNVNLTLFSGGKQKFSVDCGIRPHGCTSRGYPKKSYQIKFSAEYGPTKLQYRLFDNLETDEFDSIVLRSGSQDNDGPMMRDEYVSSLVAGSSLINDVPVQAYRPVNLYINSEYWGIYYIREHIDEDMIAAHYGCEPEEVTILEQMSEIKCGKAYKEWFDLWEFLKNNKLDNEDNYNYVKETVDLNSVADYYIVQLWSGNVDTDNVRVGKAGDGKWFYILYDLDLCLYEAPGGTADRILGRFNSGLYTFNALIYRLLENEEFRDLFLERMEALMDDTFSDENVLGQLEKFENLLGHDMVYNCERWQDADDPSHGINYRSYKGWQSSVEALKREVTGRAALVIGDFKKAKNIE